MDATIAESLLVSEEGHADWLRWSSGSPAASSSARSGKYKRRKRNKTRRSRVPRHPCAHTAQQSYLFWILKVPQFQFIDRLWMFHLCHRDGRAQCKPC